jgi:hypothetical protein
MNEQDLDQEVEVGEVEETTTKRKRIIAPTSIVTISEVFQVVIEPDTMILQKKAKYEDSSENWIFDGYFQQWDSLLKDVHKSMIKERLSKKSEHTLLELLQVFKETKKEIEDWFNTSLNLNN